MVRAAPRVTACAPEVSAEEVRSVFRSGFVEMDYRFRHNLTPAEDLQRAAALQGRARVLSANQNRLKHEGAKYRVELERRRL